MTKVNMSGWSQEQMDNWQDPMLANVPENFGRRRSPIQYQQGDPQQMSSQMYPQQTGLGGLMGNKNLGLWRDQLFGQGGPLGGGPRRNLFTQGPPRGRPWQGGPEPRPYNPGGYPRPKPQYDVAGGFEEFGETLGGYKETLGGYGEQLGGFGETLGGYGEQISGFEEQLGGFGEQFSGIEEQVGGVGEDIGEINERLGGIEEGISTLSVSKPEQKQNPYSNMFNPFSFIGNWGGSRSRMSYR